MLNFINKLFLGDFVFILSDIFFISIILFVLLYGLVVSKLIKSLFLHEIIIDFSIMVIVWLFFFHLDILWLDINVVIFNCLKIDSFSIFFKLLLDISVIGVLFVSRKYYLLHKVLFFEYVIILLLSLEGSFLLLMANNLFFFYLAVEIQNLNYYILAASKRYSSFSVEAGLKYFLLGAFSSGLLLFGISAIYLIYGELNFETLYYLLLNREFLVFDFYLCFAFSFLLIGLLFKFGASPFHWWVVDVYVGSPTIITMIFSIIPKIVYIFIFIKFIYFFFIHEQVFFSIIFFISGLLSIIIGFINAMYEEDIKNFLAYSTINNIGYMLVGLGTFDINVIAYVVFYMICYLISVFGIFFCLILYTKKDNIEIKTVFQLSLYTKYSWILGFFISLNFFSFAGLPPFSGFFAKLFVFFAMMESYFYFGIVLLLLSSVISVFYYIRMIRYIFFSFNKVEKMHISCFNLKYLEFFIFISLFNILFIFFFEYFVKIIIYFLMQII